MISKGPGSFPGLLHFPHFGYTALFELSADHYDLLHSHKRYEREAHHLRDRLWRIEPGLQKVLDLGCGTGAHDEILSQFYEVDGLDLHTGFLERARQRNPGGHYYEADMCDFRLDRMYDAIVCLFGSIGYAQTYGRLVSALRCCREHLTQRGVVIIEPWVEPERWHNDAIRHLHNERDGSHIVRMAHGRRHGGISVIDCHYLIGTPGEGVTHRQERHEVGLFTSEHMRQGLDEAGLALLDYDALGLASDETGRGLYIARAKETE
jgi:SAM-dependent methyltransferase